MIPADKSFGANNFSCNSFVLWLVVNTEFVLLQSAFHCLYDVLFVQKLLLKFIFKNQKYDKLKKYFLIVVDDKTGMETFRREVIMDLAFAGDFGFGF